MMLMQLILLMDLVILLGCTDSVMFNYDSLATQNDGSCYPIIPGCLDPEADNYFELIGNNYSRS